MLRTTKTIALKPTLLLKFFVAGALGVSMAACEPNSGDIAPERGNHFTATASPTPTPQITARHARLEALRLWLDCSTSGDDAVFAKNVDDLIVAIERHKQKISGVEVICFSNGDRSVWAEVVNPFIWGDFPSSPPFAPDFSKAPANAKVFQDAKDRWIDEQKAAYDRDQAKIMAGYEARTVQSLADLKARLLEKPAHAATCTRFFDFAKRLQRENRPLNLPVTDGFADCADEALDLVPKLNYQGRIVIVQIPARGDTADRSAELEARESFLKTLFPTATVYPVYMAQMALDELLN